MAQHQQTKTIKARGRRLLPAFAAGVLISGFSLVASVPAQASTASYTIDCTGSTTSQSGITFTQPSSNYVATVNLGGSAAVDVTMTLENCASAEVYGGTPASYNPYTAPITFTVPVGTAGGGAGKSFFAIGGGRTYGIDFYNFAPVVANSITSSCTFNGVKDLVINATPAVAEYTVVKRGAGTAGDTASYDAWLELHTPEGQFGEGVEAIVTGDATDSLTYDYLAALATVFGTTYTYKFFPVDSNLDKSGTTAYCSITFNVTLGGTAKNFGKSDKTSEPARSRESVSGTSPSGKKK